MGTKDCGRWALYGSSEVAGVSVSGRTSCRSVGGRRFSVGALNSDGSEVDRFPSCGNCSRALTSMCT